MDIINVILALLLIAVVMLTDGRAAYIVAARLSLRGRGVFAQG
jgi:hypothetical protein